MVPRILIDVAEVPGGGELKLIRRGVDWFITLAGNELMTSRMSESEVALGRIACARIGGRAGARMLIGGLGMGFTLRAALADLKPDAKVSVAELVPGVIKWARGELAEIFAGCLDDPRVEIVESDVARVIGAAPRAWDAILLDVDNGPDGLTRAGNQRLYTAVGLEAARAALTRGGVLAVWSAAPDAKFARRLAEAGFAVDEVEVRSRASGKGARHVIWFAQRVD